MKVFISHRTSDTKEVDSVISGISDIEFLSHRILESSEDIWKAKVKSKMQEADLVIFFLGKSVNESKPVNWEFDLARSLNKKCIGAKLNLAEIPKYFQNELIINGTSSEIETVLKNQKLKTTDNLLIEQYKIMVSSTEKVTEQRLKVNNLFFTVTTSLLSISALVGKLIGFENKETALLAVGVMLFFTVVAFVISFFWQKLVNSYGQLNTGKFSVINEIEDRLNTNLFQREWEILQNEVGYKSNTKTESNIIIWFRVFIIIIGLIEIIYLTNLQFNLF